MIRCSNLEQNLNFFAYLSLFIFSFHQPFFLPYSDIQLADHLKPLVACSFIFLYLYPCSCFPGMPFSLRALSSGILPAPNSRLFTEPCASLYVILRLIVMTQTIVLEGRDLIFSQMLKQYFYIEVQYELLTFLKYSVVF